MAKGRMRLLGLMALVFVGGFVLGRISVERSVEQELSIHEPKIPIGSEPNVTESRELVIAQRNHSEFNPSAGAINNEDVLLLARSLTGFERLKLRLGIKNAAGLNDRFRLFENERMSSIELTDDFQTAFELGDVEFRELQELFRAVNDELEQLEANSAEGSWAEDGSEWVFEIPTFPEQGGVLYDRISNGLESAIGPEKMMVFHETYGGQFEKRFGHMGTRERTLKFSLLPIRLEGGEREFQFVDQNQTGIAGTWVRNTSRHHESDLRKIIGSLTEKFPLGFFDQNPDG